MNSTMKKYIAALLALLMILTLLTGCTDSSEPVIGGDSTILPGEEPEAGNQQQEEAEQEEGEQEEEEPDVEEEPPTEEEPTAPELIGLEKAKKIALQDAGFSEKQAKFTVTKLEKPKNQKYYNISFTADETSYCYHIDPYSGQILYSAFPYKERPVDYGGIITPAVPMPIKTSQVISLAHQAHGISEKNTVFYILETIPREYSKEEWYKEFFYRTTLYQGKQEYTCLIDPYHNGTVLEKGVEDKIYNPDERGFISPGDAKKTALLYLKEFHTHDKNINFQNAVFHDIYLMNRKQEYYYFVRYDKNGLRYTAQINAMTGKCNSAHSEKIKK